MLFFSKVFFPYLVCEMDRVCFMNRCSQFCTMCDSRPYFLHFIQTLTLKSKWFFPSGAFHDAHHCNIWIVSPKIINLPSQHPWGVQVLSICYKQAIKAEWDWDQISPLFSDCWIWDTRDTVKTGTFCWFIFRHNTLNFGPLFPNFSACQVISWDIKLGNLKKRKTDFLIVFQCLVCVIHLAS